LVHLYLVTHLKTESVDQAAARLLTECTQIKELHQNQFKVFVKQTELSKPHKELIIKRVRNTKSELDYK
jgi:arginine repressor